jgi:hypothetical protein
MSKVIDHRLAGYPAGCTPSGRVILVTVLAHDEICDQVAAYAGVLADNGEAPTQVGLDWIAANGSKLTEREAAKLFTLTKEYRR